MKTIRLYVMGILSAATLVLATAVLQADPPGGHGKGMGACKADIEKFCKDVKHGHGRMWSCLQGHEKELSAECKAHHAQVKNETHDACFGDVEKFCSDVEPGKGRILECMKKNKDKLSAECKKAHPKL